MTKEIILAKIVIRINHGDSVDGDLLNGANNLFKDTQHKIELLNAVIIPHIKRYSQCFSDALRSTELAMTVSDFECVFSSIHPNWLSKELLEYSIMFSTEDNFASNNFKNICVNLMDALSNCDVHEVRHWLYRQIISRIISCRLYGSEPFDSILESATLALEEININPELVNVMMLPW